MRINSTFHLAFLLFLSVFISCRQSTIDKSKKNYEKFNNYITGYSQSPISRCSDIYVDLGFQIPNDVAIPSSLIEVTPNIGGQYVLNQSRNRIILKNPMIKHNVSYSVDFNIGLLKEMPDEMGTFSFPLEAERQTWDVLMQAPVNHSMEYVSYKGEVNFGVCEPTPELLESSLKAVQNDVQLPVSWIHEKRGKRKSTFTINNIKRTETPTNVDLTLSMEPLNVNDKSELKLAIPSKSDFSFHAFKIDNNQNLKLTFTDPLITNQNLSGLIEIEGRQIKSIKANGNIVDVYFENESYGYFNLKIHPGIKNLGDYPLKDSYTKELFFAPPAPSVKIAEKGNILPPSGKWELPVSMVSANGFRLRILKIYDHNIQRLYQQNNDVYQGQQGLENLGRIVLDSTFVLDNPKPYLENYHSITLDDVITKEKGALYKVILTIPRELSAYPCQEWKDNERVDNIDAIDFDRPWMTMRYNYDYYEEDYYYSGRGNLGNNYFPEEIYGSGNPCSNTYASLIQDARLLMCTDIGIVAKSEPDARNYFFYISEITSAEPLSGVNVELYNIQGKKISTGQTNSSGIANIQMTDDLAFMAKAINGSQTTYLELKDAKALSLSTFQVEGKNWQGETKVHFYGERNVWRPGDTIHMNCIVFSPKKPLLESIPVTLKLFDPTNKLVKTWVQKKSSNGIYDCHFHTDLNAPTGRWRLEMHLGGKTYRTPVRVETIRPNRLKMEIEFANDELIRDTDSKKAPVSVKWMHGLEAKDLQTEVVMLQKSVKNPFGKDYENYAFDNVAKRYERELGMIASGVTNATGKLNLEIPVEKNNSYPSMMLFNFELRAFEKGGAFSTDMKAVRYSPYSHYVGAKFPGGDSNSEIYIKDGNAIMLATLDADGNRANRKVHVTLYKIDYSWWYQFGNRGNYAALSNYVSQVEEEYDVTVGKEGKAITINEGGRFLMKIEDQSSGHSVSRVIYSYGDRWNQSNDEVSQLEVLPFLLDKTEYTVGEALSFELPPMGEGRYLITVESGGRILHKEVQQTSNNPSQVNISISSDMAPSAYVHVHLIQAWDTHINDRPIRLFGLKPIKVYDPNTILEPRITMPDELTTDETFSVTIEEAQGKNMSYTLAIVDEGLLDITQFKTPDPWSVFFGKEKLNVKTWDMYREIFKRFLGEYTSLLAVGGDGSNSIEATSKARRFKPVVKFVGPFKLNAGQSKTHKFTINNYVGSVRAMVVATNGNALGRYEKTTAVKKPLMLYATLPRVLGPQETIKVPVTVFSMDKNIKNVQSKIITNDKVNVIGKDTRDLVFKKEGEQDISFDVETIEGIGIVNLDVEVRSGSHYFKETIELDLRPSAPLISKSYHQLIEENKEQLINYKPIGMPGTRSGSISVSKGLNFSFGPHVDWLSQYPHGCLEQTISSIFPQIYLYKMNLIQDIDQMKYRQNFAAAIQKLRFLQLPNGGFSYWPGGNIANEWGTSYALQFLLEAKKYGYKVPEDMIDKCKSYQYKSAGNPVIRSRDNSRGIVNSSTIDLAYKLYTLAQAGKPNFAAMNRLRLVPELHNTAKWILAHSFIILGENDLADLMINAATQTTASYREMSGTFGSQLRDQAIIARVLIDKRDKLGAKRIIDEMVAAFNAEGTNTFSTQERSQALITFSKFISSLDKVEDTIQYDIKLSPTLVHLNKQLGFSPDVYEIDESTMSTPDINVVNNGGSEIYTTLVVTGQPLRDESKKEAQDLELKVEFLGDDGSTLDPKLIKKGTDFVVSYSIVHPGVRAGYENMALTAIFPSGWEILNQRMNENSTFNSGNTADYQDIRDDRVHLYFDIEKGGKRIFKFKMNATYEGKYWAAPAFCEAMYDSSIRAKNEGFWAIVK